MDRIKNNAKDIAELLKVLANENRIIVLSELATGPMSVNQLLENLNISQSGLSQHLTVLKASKIITSSKNAQTVIYSIKDERVFKVLKVLRKQFCSNN